MNQRDRQQAAKLIEQEFYSRRSELMKDPCCKKIEAQKPAILSEMGLTQKVKQLRKAQARAQELESELNAAFESVSRFSKSGTKS